MKTPEEILEEIDRVINLLKKNMKEEAMSVNLRTISLSQSYGLSTEHLRILKEFILDNDSDQSPNQ